MRKIDRKEALSLLETYEPLLTSRQASIMDAYFRYDLSLAEIAEEEGITRAGALDAIHKSIAKLKEYEEKLGFNAYQASLRQNLQKSLEGDSKAKAKLEELIEHGI